MVDALCQFVDAHQHLVVLAGEAELQVRQFLVGHHGCCRLAGDVAQHFVLRGHEHVVAHRCRGGLLRHWVQFIAHLAHVVQIDLLAPRVGHRLDAVVLLPLLPVEREIGQQTGLVALRTLRGVGLDKRQRQCLLEHAEFVEVTSQVADEAAHDDGHCAGGGLCAVNRGHGDGGGAGGHGSHYAISHGSHGGIARHPSHALVRGIGGCDGRLQRLRAAHVQRGASFVERNTSHGLCHGHFASGSRTVGGGHGDGGSANSHSGHYAVSHGSHGGVARCPRDTLVRRVWRIDGCSQRLCAAYGYRGINLVERHARGGLCHGDRTGGGL